MLKFQIWKAKNHIRI